MIISGTVIKIIGVYLVSGALYAIWDVFKKHYKDYKAYKNNKILYSLTVGEIVSEFFFLDYLECL